MSEKKTNKINLLYVIQSLENGGAETLAIRLAARLDKNCFNAAVCSLSDNGPLRELLERKKVPYFTLGKREGKDFKVALRLRRLLQQQRINLVHTHNQGPLLYTYLATLLSPGTRIVHTEHINMAKEFSYSRKHLLYNNLLYRSLDGFVNIARHLTDDYCSRFDLSKVRVRTIHNSVDLELVPGVPATGLRQELNIPATAPLIGNISALRPQKDHPTLIRAMAKVCRQVPEAVLVIAGEGESKAELVELVGKLGLEANVRFLGFRADVGQLLAQFDLFVLSSLYEGLPLCILEALAAGRPIVATDADGTNEVVQDGVTGLLVPLSSPEQFAAAILALLADPARAERLGQEGRRYVAEQHNMATMISQYEQFYREVLSPAG